MKVHSNGNSFASGTSYTESAEVTLPRGTDGPYFIYVVTDAHPIARYLKSNLEVQSGDNEKGVEFFTSRVCEGPNEQNNIGQGAISVTYREPDLQITDLIVPSTPPQSGQTIQVSWTTTNVGTRETREYQWVDRLYLSKDPSLDSGDYLLGGEGHYGFLAVDGA